MRIFSTALLFLLPACDPPDERLTALPSEMKVVLSHDQWTVVESVGQLGPGDPFQDPKECPDSSINIEGDYLEINTDYCADVVMEQALPEDLESGTTLSVDHWHLTLWSPEPSVGTFQFSAEGEVFAQRTFDIPGGADYELVEWQIADDLPAGTTFRLTLQNHGTNSWRFGDVTTSRTPKVTR